MTDLGLMGSDREAREAKLYKMERIMLKVW